LKSLSQPKRKRKSTHEVASKKKKKATKKRKGEKKGASRLFSRVREVKRSKNECFLAMKKEGERKGSESEGF